MMGNQVPALRLGNQLSTQRVCIVAGETQHEACGWLGEAIFKVKIIVFAG